MFSNSPDKNTHKYPFKQHFYKDFFNANIRIYKISTCTNENGQKAVFAQNPFVQVENF